MRLIAKVLPLAVLLTFVIAVQSADESNADRLVQVLVTSQANNPYVPWQKQRPQRRMGYGVLIRDKVILTTETLVRNNTLVEIMLPGSGKKLRAREMLSDSQANLALVALVDQAKALPNTELPLADDLKIGDKSTVIQLDNTSAIQACEGKVLQISLSRTSNSSFLLLTYTLLTKPQVNRIGAPVFAAGKLAGMALPSDSDEQSTIIPSPVIKRFLKDAKEPPYSGFPSAGLQWVRLVDPAKRKYFGLPEDDENGIQVLSTIPGTGSSDVLQPNDVILEIDGIPIDSLGFYEDESFGRILFPYIINGRHIAGEKIKVSLMRDRKKTAVEIELKAWKDSESLIPEDYLGEMNKYIVSGGLLIRELSRRSLPAYGNSWQRGGNPRLSYFYDILRYSPEKKGDRIVILYGVLPDTINMGYQYLRNVPVTTINGVEVRNMSDVFEAVDKNKGLHSVGLMSYDTDIYLDPSELEAANKRILNSYRIPAIDSRKLAELRDQ